jgi:two-component system phosphate regulon sensor histidine kinase PhoR
VLLISVTLVTADFLLTRYTAERERTRVQQQMAQNLRFLVPSLVANPPREIQKWAEDRDAELDARVTVIDGSGVVLADSRHDPETMENHSERPEIRDALAGRPSHAIRRSATMDVDFSYYAVPLSLPGHARAVLRLAIPLTQVGASISAVQSLILRSSLLAALIALLIAYLLARTFTGRIRRIENYAADLVKADYSGTLAAEGDDELGSVARSLRSMAEHFRHMLDLLAKESARRTAILSSMVEGVIAVEHDLRITFYNDAFAHAVRARAPLQEGMSMLQVVRDPALRSLLSRVMNTHTPGSERISLLNSEGRVFQVQAAPLEGQGTTGAIATLHDITELERLERVRKDFVANLSHELRTPLAAIHGYTETLLAGALEDSDNNRKFLEIIANHTARLASLASDLLALSEIEGERPAAPAEVISAVEMAENAMHAVAAQAGDRQVRVYLGAAEDSHIAGQQARLERALSNLLLNGINYNHPGGEVRLDVRQVNKTTRISVTDTGIGISSQDIPRIFERFYRVDKARSRQTGGTGLGLSIVRNTVERAGGSITVESQLGKGSVFTLTFPSI